MWDFDKNLAQALEYHRNEEPRFDMSGANLLLLRPRPHHGLLELVRASACCTVYQPYKPHFEAYKEVAKTTTEDFGGPFSSALVCATKDKKETLGLAARALENLEDNGLFTLVAENDLGGSGYAKLLRKLAPEAIASSKKHYRIISFSKNEIEDASRIEEWHRNFKPSLVKGTQLQAAPGMFSYKKCDTGSSLLLSVVPQELPGDGADLCCGYGYLTSELLAKGSNSITLFDACKASLTAAEKNLTSLQASSGPALHFEWKDATQELGSGPFDWIVMNPPFHMGKEGLPEMGIRIIKQAAKSLKAGGVLYMVANSHLPYRSHIEQLFSSVEILFNGKGFHVYAAKK